MAFGSCFFGGRYVFAQTNPTESKLQAATNSVDVAFSAVSDAEKAGANVTGLLVQLNVAAGDLAQAENFYRTGNSNTAAAQADDALSISQQVSASAQSVNHNASVSGQTAFWLTIAFGEVGAPVFVLGLFLVWRRYKRGYMEKLPSLKPEVVEDAA